MKFKDELIGISILLFILLSIIFSMVFALHVQKDIYENTEEFCNKEFGENNWRFAEKKKETFKEKIYPGQIWECVESG